MRPDPQGRSKLKKHALEASFAHPVFGSASALVFAFAFEFVCAAMPELASSDMLSKNPQSGIEEVRFILVPLSCLENARCGVLKISISSTEAFRCWRDGFALLQCTRASKRSFLKGG